MKQKNKTKKNPISLLVSVGFLFPFLFLSLPLSHLNKWFYVLLKISNNWNLLYLCVCFMFSCLFVWDFLVLSKRTLGLN